MATDNSDLHYTKKSHFSVPMDMTKHMEWHFEPKDVPNKNVKPGEKGHIVVPVKAASNDKDGIRFKQDGAPFNPILPKGFTLKHKASEK